VGLDPVAGVLISLAKCLEVVGVRERGALSTRAALPSGHAERGEACCHSRLACVAVAVLFCFFQNFFLGAVLGD
jgi:hypothetical protein